MVYGWACLILLIAHFCASCYLLGKFLHQLIQPVNLGQRSVGQLLVVVVISRVASLGRLVLREHVVLDLL